MPVAVAACDVYRPAAVDQLIKVGTQAGAAVYEQGTDRDPVKIAAWARDRAQSEGKDVLIIDTSGRLHIDKELMAELANIKLAVRPHDVLLVVDAMTGQDAVNVAEQFAEVVQFDGVVMTKLDGDARGGAALSVKEITTWFADRYGEDYEKKITPRWIGFTIRKRLGLKTQKSHGQFVIPPSEIPKLNRLYEKYGISKEEVVGVELN